MVGHLPVDDLTNANTFSGLPSLEDFGCLADAGSPKCPDGKECIIKDGKLRCDFVVKRKQAALH